MWYKTVHVDNVSFFSEQNRDVFMGQVEDIVQNRTNVINRATKRDKRTQSYMIGYSI